MLLNDDRQNQKYKFSESEKLFFKFITKVDPEMFVIGSIQYGSYYRVYNPNKKIIQYNQQTNQTLLTNLINIEGLFHLKYE